MPPRAQAWPRTLDFFSLVETEPAVLPMSFALGFCTVGMTSPLPAAFEGSCSSSLPVRL